MKSLTWTSGTASARFRREGLLARCDALHPGLRDHARLAGHHLARVVWVRPFRAAVLWNAFIYATCETMVHIIIVMRILFYLFSIDIEYL